MTREAAPQFHRKKACVIGSVPLRTLSGGKPIGFKLCIGLRRRFMAIPG